MQYVIGRGGQDFGRHRPLFLVCGLAEASRASKLWRALQSEGMDDGADTFVSLCEAEAYGGYGGQKCGLGFKVCLTNAAMHWHVFNIIIYLLIYINSLGAMMCTHHWSTMVLKSGLQKYMGGRCWIEVMVSRLIHQDTSAR